MPTSTLDRSLIFLMRVFIGWLFLYSGASEIIHGKSSVGFLTSVKTFHDAFAMFATPTLLPITDFLVNWGHLLIGLSLVSGLMVRVSGPFGILLMITYHFAHMDWPYITDHYNLFLDFHATYAVVIAYLMLHNAGHAWGLDGFVGRLPFIERNPGLRPLFA
jgi:thiosulfate dehydrogenase (quinone) large subunit